MLFVPLILAVWNTNAAVHYDMQCLLIEQSFDSVNNAVLQVNSLGQSPRALCSWRSNNHFSAGCELKVLKVLRINELLNLGSIRLQFLPNTIESLIICDCDQKLHINTRYLPREANRINLSRNRIFGSIDLTDLPLHLEVLDLSSNQLTGEISLTRLPRLMKKLLLKNNRLAQDIVWYQHLPEKLVRVELTGNRIQRVSTLDDEIDDTVNVQRKFRL